MGQSQQDPITPNEIVWAVVGALMLIALLVGAVVLVVSNVDISLPDPKATDTPQPGVSQPYESTNLDPVEVPLAASSVLPEGCLPGIVSLAPPASQSPMVFGLSALIEQGFDEITLAVETTGMSEFEFGWSWDAATGSLEYLILHNRSVLYHLPVICFVLYEGATVPTAIFDQARTEDI